MSDVQRCPRCEVRVVTEDRRRQKLGRCPHCYYAFCLLCRERYHGEDCAGPRSLLMPPPDGAAAAAGASGGGVKSEFLASLRGLVGQHELSDVALEEINFSSPHRNCPVCWTYIEKTVGCNHMQCWECKTHFCWFCLTVLRPTDPYSHFRDGNCSGRLFEPVELEAE